MKNSEMKTIIRHIDRLTRNLNARGRRRYADAPDEQQRRNIESAAQAVKNWSRKVLDAVFDIQNDCKLKSSQNKISTVARRLLKL